MISNEFWIVAGGVHSVALFLFHLCFWRLLGWKKDLRHISPVNRAVIQILNLRIMYVFGALALACFYFRGELLESKVGVGLLGAASLFWIGRLIEQIIFLRKGNLIVHALTAMFVVGAIVFAMPVVNLL